MNSTSPAPRRVPAHEVRARMGWGATWLRVQIKIGRFPPPFRDPGGRRLWWLAEDVDDAIRKLADDAARLPTIPRLTGAAARTAAGGGASAGTRSSQAASKRDGARTGVHTTIAPGSGKPETLRRGRSRT